MGLRHIKLGTSILMALAISTLLMRYMEFTDRPKLNILKAKDELSSSIALFTLNITTPIKGIFLAQHISPTDTPTSTINSENSTSIDFDKTPTIIPISPTRYLLPTAKTSMPTENIIMPTAQPKPTNRPKPTNMPEPTPTPLAPAEYLRPGKSLEDIFKVAGELSCMPAAVLKSFVAQEGPGALTYSDKSALFYNAYDWWHRVTEKKQVCSGYGYFPETGLIAEDSLFAGERCKEAFSPETANDTTSRSLGATQILEYYWNKDYKEKTKQKLKVEKVDRRVLLDALVGFGIAFKEGVKYNGPCDTWDFKYVMRAACINAGTHCEKYNYCYTICNNYNKFSGQTNNCNGVNDLFVPDSYCEFK